MSSAMPLTTHQGGGGAAAWTGGHRQELRLWRANCGGVLLFLFLIHFQVLRPAAAALGGRALALGKRTPHRRRVHAARRPHPL